MSGEKCLKMQLSLIIFVLSISVLAVHSSAPLKYKPHDEHHQQGNVYPFQNVSLDWKTRVDDLVSRLTLDEVIAQLSYGGAGDNGPAPAISRLGIAPFQWNSECLRGYVDSGSSTSFPQAINLAASFDKSIVYRVAEAGASEARAKHADYVKQGNYHDHTGKYKQVSFSSMVVFRPQCKLGRTH